ncbi:MAG: RodZ domain-containing protein [Candidatus Omnitrophota bacterium]|jgi:cytoskeletal protein RodZ
MKQIGEKLKKIRLEKGLSLEDVQKQTKIHLNILKAIEGDGLTDLSPVYLKAFIKIYAKFLGLKPEELLPEHKEELPRQAPDFKPSSLKLKPVKPDRKLFKISVFIFTVLIVLTGVFQLGKFISSRRKPAAQEVQKKQKSKTAPQAFVQKEASNGVRLVIIAKENCMLTLRVDGKIFFQGVLIKGRSESWKAKEKMELSLSNAGAVELIVNSQHFSNIGKRKQKLSNILINREGLHIGR